MSFNLKMGLKLTQKLKMTPQLQQSIKLLTLPLMELEQAVREELLENPVLEEVQDTKEDSSIDEQYNEENVPERSTWMEFTDSGSCGLPRFSHKKNTSSATFNIENVVSTQQTLQDHLIWQIQMSGFSNKEKAHLHILIERLDENGYLRVPLLEIAEEVSVSIYDLQENLETLHTLDPSGVGAKDLKECLLIQARQGQEDTKDLVTLITNHLPDLEKKNYSLIAQTMGLQEEEIMDLYKIITAMEPKPGRRFVSQPVMYITPDVYVVKTANGYQVSLNEEGLPHLKVAPVYQDMIQNLGKSKAGSLEVANSTQKYLRYKMNSALWLIRSLNQRQRTIFQVTSAIVQSQKEFFDKGPIGMKPMILKQIAEKVGVHESTVSRVTTNKYVHTPHGIYELKYFFSVGIEAETGERFSGEIVKLKLKAYIDKEDKKQPLSDQDLGNQLYKDLKVSLARRTISKYRENLKILPSSRRKTL